MGKLLKFGLGALVTGIVANKIIDAVNDRREENQRMLEEEKQRTLEWEKGFKREQEKNNSDFKEMYTTLYMLNSLDLNYLRSTGYFTEKELKELERSRLSSKRNSTNQSNNIDSNIDDNLDSGYKEKGTSSKSRILTPKEVFKKSIDKVLVLHTSFSNSNSYGGTGIVIKNKYVLTNAHVITDIVDGVNVISNQITGYYYKSRNGFSLKPIYCNEDLDIAILKADLYNDMPYFKLSTKEIEVGQNIYAIGNTHGEGLCMLDGLVSDISRYLYNNEYFMFNAQVYHGNSGGPVINEYGEVIGMVSKSDTEVKNMNYAIPSKVIIDVLRKQGIKS